LCYSLVGLYNAIEFFYLIYISFLENDKHLADVKSKDLNLKKKIINLALTLVIVIGCFFFFLH